MARARASAPVAVSQTEMLGLLAEKLSLQAREPNALAYQPHYKQEMFHRSVAKTRVYIGGNRSGKSYGGVMEGIYRARGVHPYLKVPSAPTRGRVVCVDYSQGINQIQLPLWKRLVPSNELKGGTWEKAYHTDSKILTFQNGSTIEFMSYEQKLDSFAGTSRHWISFDEEPPKPIWDECLARLVDTNGEAWLTLTPINGMTWIYDTLYLPGVESTNKNIQVIQVDMHENPHLNPEAIERYLESLDPDERRAREKGVFVQMGGLVYKKFDPDTHVIPYTSELLDEVKKYEPWTSMDHGYNAPSAWLWHAVAADGTIVTFAEHYKAEMTVEEHAKTVLSFEKSMGLAEPAVRAADPATAQRQGVTGTSIQTEYAINGVFLSPGNNDVQTGVAKVQQYLRINPKTKKPYWLIADNCVNLIKEIKRLRWATHATKQGQYNNNPQEKIHKKDDHACDSARYFFSFMPTLEGPVAEVSKKELDRSSGQRYDEVLARMASPTDSNGPTSWSFEPDSIASFEWE